MASFEIAIPIVLQHEGSNFTFYKNDPGGATKYGITLSDLVNGHIDVNQDGVVNVLDVKALTEKLSEDYYLKNFWNKLYDQANSQLIITKIFDFGVNAGEKNSVRQLQRVLNTHFGANLDVDGQFGQVTLNVLNSQKDEKSVHHELQIEELNYYNDIVCKNPKLKMFLNGWNRRCLSC